MSYFRIILGFFVAFLLGSITRWLKIPAPAPPTFIGAFLIVAVSAGYICTDHLLGSVQNEIAEKSKETSQISEDDRTKPHNKNAQETIHTDETAD